MSVLATVMIYECDGCKRTIGLKTDAEYTTFEATWFDGMKYHFCPLCRETPDASAMIIEDSAFRAQVSAAVQRIAAAKAKEAIANHGH